MDMETTDPPEGFGYIFAYFAQLSGRRNLSGNGPCPISYPDVGWYCTLHGVQLTRWELDLILRIDDVWLKDYYARVNKSNKQEPE